MAQAWRMRENRVDDITIIVASLVFPSTNDTYYVF